MLLAENSQLRTFSGTPSTAAVMLPKFTSHPRCSPHSMPVCCGVDGPASLPELGTLLKGHPRTSELSWILLRPQQQVYGSLLLPSVSEGCSSREHFPINVCRHRSISASGSVSWGAQPHTGFTPMKVIRSVPMTGRFLSKISAVRAKKDGERNWE